MDATSARVHIQYLVAMGISLNAIALAAGLNHRTAGLIVHLICDNYATHKHAAVRDWLDKHPRFHLHFTPTSSSGLNLVERWFRELTDKALRRGVFHSVPDLITTIEDYLTAHNDNPKPFIWTANADDILTKVARGRVALQAVNQ